MCGPALAIIGAVVSAAGTMASANAQASQAKYNAQVEDINARTKRQEGMMKADMLEDDYQRQRATGRVAAAKSGVNPASGSASFVINQESYANQASDQLATIWNAETAAIGHENRAAGLRAEAKSFKQAGMLGAASTFLGGLKGGSFKMA